MEPLEHQLDRLAAGMLGFQPSAWFETEMDQLIFLIEDGNFRADRLDAFLTLLWHPHQERLVGFKIKGFRWLYQVLVLLDKVPADGFVPMMDILEAAITAGLTAEASVRRFELEALAERRRKYFLAREIADYRIPLSELPIAA